MSKSRSSFAFMVLAYNQQEYVLDHLESIRWLVESYGSELDVDLIISDDGSIDNTRIIINFWLAHNARLFRLVKTIYNIKNLGTCASVNNMLAHVNADRCKLTAADDIYSFENIFELTKYDLFDAMISGRALYLLNNVLSVSGVSNYLATATHSIYKSRSLLYRLKHFSYNNAPNLLYATKCLLHPNVRSFLGEFDVTEDWPIQIAIARNFPTHKFKLIDNVLVYYRRTAGSTYIVSNQRFVADKIKIYNNLISNEVNWVERQRLRSRKACFISQNWWINKFLNIDFYFFVISCIYHLFEIYKCSKEFRIPLDKHRQHYEYIRATAAEFRGKIK